MDRSTVPAVHCRRHDHDICAADFKLAAGITSMLDVDG